MIYHEQYNLHEGDEITHFQRSFVVACPKDMCKIIRFKAENEKYAKMGVYSETTGKPIIPDEPRESLEIVCITGNAQANQNMAFIVSKNEKGYELYNFDGTRFIEGIYKKYLFICRPYSYDVRYLLLTNLEGKSAIFNEKCKISNIGWVDKIQEREKYLEISNNGKKAITDLGGEKILVPFYDDCGQVYTVKYADSIYRDYYDYKDYEKICIIRNGENYGIYSVTKQKEIYPLKAKSIIVNTQLFRDTDNTVKVAGYPRHITNITIVDHNMKKHVYDFTSDFEEVVNSYESLNCIYCHKNHDRTDRGYVFKILEYSDGHFVMTNENGIIEKIGVFDSYEPVISQESPKFVGFRIHKDNKQSYFSIEYGELVVDFYETVSVPELIRNPIDKFEYDHISIISDGKLFGVYSYRSKKEIYPIRFKEVKIQEYGCIVRFYLTDQLNRRLIQDYIISY